MPIRPENRARYPQDWPDISLRVRRDRAGWRCECRGECLAGANPRTTDTHLGPDGRCSARQGEPTRSGRWRVVLTVAHLDHQPENCADWNLMAACQACHLRYDAAHHAETRRARATDSDPGAMLLF